MLQSKTYLFMQKIPNKFISQENRKKLGCQNKSLAWYEKKTFYRETGIKRMRQLAALQWKRLTQKLTINVNKVEIC